MSRGKKKMGVDVDLLSSSLRSGDGKLVCSDPEAVSRGGLQSLYRTQEDGERSIGWA